MTAADWPAYPCGCPDVPGQPPLPHDSAGHLAFHQLAHEQTGIPLGQPVNASTLQAARGMKTPAPDMHGIQARNERQGKSSPGWRREAAR